MLDLSELKQFVTFAECKTLSKTAELLHISQPTLTRTMRSVEESFGAKLFDRGKNRIELNQTGILAVEYANKLLAEAQRAVQSVQDFDRSLRTVSVKSCAPAPLWSLLPMLSHKFPENTISSKLTAMEDIIESVKNDETDIGILPYPYSDDKLACVPYIREHLFACVPEEHALYSETSLSFEQINGFNFLLRDHIGFWSEVVKRKMPASRFLVQTDDFEFAELVRSSTLLSFSTNIADHLNPASDTRKLIPITDSEADVFYHLISLDSKKELIQALAASAAK